MTSRERVLKALNHEEPDRVPIDLGGTIMSGIMAHALDRLRRHLGLAESPPKVYEVFQMLGEVEMDLVERLGVDVLPVEPPAQFFSLRRENYKPWQLWDGTEVLMSGEFRAETDAAGDLLLHEGGDPAEPVVARMPHGGFYFDIPSLTETHFDAVPPALSKVRDENRLTDESLEFLQARAERLRAETDKALLLGCWGKTGLPWVCSIPDFLMLLGTDRAYVKDLFEIRTEVALSNLEKLNACLGDKIDILGFEGADYGSQKSELFSPDWFEELFLPFYKQQNDWVHLNTKWKTWQHSCGSIAKILPMMIESGMDILNPVQCSAVGMDARGLKEMYGHKITFWGGGVDTQKTLPFGTPEDVAAEVAERMRIFAPGGGFVFNPIHNVQQGTPPENVLAAFDTVREMGVYPIRKA